MEKVTLGKVRGGEDHQHLKSGSEAEGDGIDKNWFEGT